MIIFHRLEVWPSSENGGFASRSQFFKLRINEDKFRRRFNQQTRNTKQSYETSSRTAPVVWGKAYKFTIEKLLGGPASSWKFYFCRFSSIINAISNFEFNLRSMIVNELVGLSMKRIQ